MNRLREVMDQKRVTIAEIASGTGLDPKTVWHATQDKKIRKATRLAISRFLQMAPEAIFSDSDIQKTIFTEGAQS
ncbi:hypothetical protein GCM10008019_40760 [Deinococcus soli (ex Cha et al. 2016)]|nr:hypothetical protein GCM10008019_40760 [Deinococcus soli (ex Cha et al. 2016)]